jgi:hypothetical protein
MRMRLSRTPGLCAPLAVLALLLGCGAPPPPSFPEEDQLLESLIEEYVLARLRFYPVESTLAGLPGNDDRLGSFSATDAARRIASLSDFHKKILGLRPEALSRSAYLDALWLTSLVKMELFDLEERKVLESAGFYAETIRTGLVSLLLAPDIAARTDALGARLEAIPDLLEQARENLGESPGLAARDGLEQLARCGELLSDMPLLLEERVPSYRVAELADRSRLATRALQQLEATLTTEAPRGRGSEIAPLGPDALKRFFLFREMVDWEPGRILEEAERAVELASNRMTERALESFPDRSLSAALSSSAPSTSSVSDEVTGYVQGVLAFLKATGERNAPEGPIPVLVVPPYFLAPEHLRLWRPAALSPAKDAAILVSASAGGALSEELELTTLREIAGRYRLYVRQSESGSLLRRVYRARSSSEAWGSWFVERALEKGYGGNDAELEIRFLHQRLVEALRLSVSVRIHAFDLDLAAAEREFRERAFLPPERARADAERAALDPGAGSPALGRLLLDGIAHDYENANPLASAEEVERLLLSESLIPLRLVRFNVVGLPAE